MSHSPPSVWPPINRRSLLLGGMSVLAVSLLGGCKGCTSSTPGTPPDDDGATHPAIDAAALNALVEQVFSEHAWASEMSGLGTALETFRQQLVDTMPASADAVAGLANAVVTPLLVLCTELTQPMSTDARNQALLDKVNGLRDGVSALDIDTIRGELSAAGGLGAFPSDVATQMDEDLVSRSREVRQIIVDEGLDTHPIANFALHLLHDQRRALANERTLQDVLDELEAGARTTRSTHPARRQSPRASEPPPSNLIEDACAWFGLDALSWLMLDDGDDDLARSGSSDCDDIDRALGIAVELFGLITIWFELIQYLIAWSTVSPFTMLIGMTLAFMVLGAACASMCAIINLTEELQSCSD